MLRAGIKKVFLTRLTMVVSVVITCVGGAFAADNPFWYNGTIPSTNRVEVGCGSSVNVNCDVEFSLWSERCSAETTFNTYPLGLMFIVR
jgi:hypothetical protein